MAQIIFINIPIMILQEVTVEESAEYEDDKGKNATREDSEDDIMQHI